MILISPTAFKGTLTARAVADAMAAGVAGAAPDADVGVIPLSDGGNGLLVAMESAAGGKGRGARVTGPLGTSVTARYLVQRDRVVVETAEACGLHLVPAPLRDPMRTSTRGVGELLLAATEAAPGVPLVVGLGGSATVDAGAGMLAALGWELLDRDGGAIGPGCRGLLELQAIEPPDDPVVLPELRVLADVRNPLLGARGAARVFGPQKGARPADIPVLERALEQWVRVVERDLDRDVADDPGTGAAGGLGAAFAAFLNAPPEPGARWILEAVDFDARLSGADVVVTGEGRWDEQSMMGKATGEVVTRATAAGVQVLVVAGTAAAPAPDGAVVVDGGGGEMDVAAVRTAVAGALPGLLAGRRDR